MKLKDLKSYSDDELRALHDRLQEKIEVLWSKQFKIQDEQAKRKEADEEWAF